MRGYAHAVIALFLFPLPLVLFSYPLLQGSVTVLAAVAFLFANARVLPFKDRAVSELETGYLCAIVVLSLLSVRSGVLLSAPAADTVAWHQAVVDGAVVVLLLLFPTVGLPVGTVRVVQRCRRDRDQSGARPARLKSPIIRGASTDYISVELGRSHG